MVTCGKYGCQRPIKDKSDIYCAKHGGRKQAVAEGLVPAKKPELSDDARGVVPPGKGYAGTAPNPAILEEKREAARKLKQQEMEARRNRPKKQKKNKDEDGGKKKGKDKGEKDKRRAAKNAAKH